VAAGALRAVPCFRNSVMVLVTYFVVFFYPRPVRPTRRRMQRFHQWGTPRMRGDVLSILEAIDTSPDSRSGRRARSRDRRESTSVQRSASSPFQWAARKVGVRSGMQLIAAYRSTALEPTGLSSA
jgi:hypothetical protein